MPSGIYKRTKEQLNEWIKSYGNKFSAITGKDK